MALSGFLSSVLRPVVTLVSDLPARLTHDLLATEKTVTDITSPDDKPADVGDDLTGDQDTGDADNEVEHGDVTDPEDLLGDQETGNPDNPTDGEEPDDGGDDDLKGDQDTGDADNDVDHGDVTDPDDLKGDQQKGDADNDTIEGDVTDPEDLLGDQETGNPGTPVTKPVSNPLITGTALGGEAAVDGQITYDEIDQDVFVTFKINGIADGAETQAEVIIDGNIYQAELSGDTWVATVPVSSLNNGEIFGTVSVKVTDANGGVSTRQGQFDAGVTVDLTEPAVSDPEIGTVSLTGAALADGKIDHTETNQNINVSFNITGVEPDASVSAQVTIDGKTYDAAMLNGEWTATVPVSSIPEGEGFNGTVSVTVTDATGTVHAETKTFQSTVTVDFTEPAPVSDPVIGEVTFGGDAVADGSITFDEASDIIQAYVTVDGIAAGADAEVTISISGTSYTAQLADGQWVVNIPTKDLNNGSVSGAVSVKVTDADGTVKTAASSFISDISVDMTEPVTTSDPVVDSVTFHGEILEDGTLTSDELNSTFEVQVEVSGVEAGASVDVSVEVDGTVYQAEEVNGVYVAEVPASELADGEASGTATVKVTDANGETSHASSTFNTTIDTDFSNPTDGAFGPEVQSTGEVEMDIANMTSYTTGKGQMGVESDFNIEFSFSPMAGGTTSEVKAALIQMGEYISSLINGNLENFGAVDDVKITVVDTTRDGEGGVHAGGSVTGVRTSGDDAGIGHTGSIFVDIDDIESMMAEGVFNDIILHELLHALGFGDGDNWDALLDDSQEFGDSFRFTGEAAIAAYNAQHPDIAGQDDFSNFGVPVESDFGKGNARSHWDRATFDKTDGGLMAAGTSEYYYGGIDAMTLAAFEDMGYETTWDASDPGARPEGYDKLPAAVQDPDLVDDAQMAAAEDLDDMSAMAAAEDIDDNDDAEVSQGADKEAWSIQDLFEGLVETVEDALVADEKEDEGLAGNLLDALLGRNEGEAEISFDTGEVEADMFVEGSAVSDQIVDFGVSADAGAIEFHSSIDMMQPIEEFMG